MRRDQKKKEGKHRKGRFQARQVLGEVWKAALFFSSDCGTELAFRQRSRRTTEKDGCSHEDAAGSAGKRTQMERGNFTKVEAVERRRRTEMKKVARRLRCTLLNGSSWSAVKNMRRHKGKRDIFLEIQHRLRREEMEEQSNREAKEGWSCSRRSKNHR